MLGPAVRRSVLLGFLCLALAGCSRSYERPITDWCRVRVREPLMGGGGMVQAGPDEKETLFVRKEGRWSEVGHGSSGRVTRLAGDRAVLWYPSLGGPGLFVTQDGAARPVSGLFPCAGWQTISPDGRWIDCGTCREGGLASCRAVDIQRRSLDGSVSGEAAADPAGACRFRVPGVRWYDAGGRAYALAECADGSRVLFRADFASDVERFASTRAIDDAPGWYQAVGRVSLRDPKAFQPLRERPDAPIPR
jgi:hypothetical protein